MEDGLIHGDGEGDRIVVSGDDSDRSGQALWEYTKSTGCLRVVQAGDSPIGGPAIASWPSVEGTRLAYMIAWSASSGTDTCQIRLRNLETGESRVVDTNTSADQPGSVPGCFNDYVAMEYPWVVWRDIRERPPGGTRIIPYQSNALAVNAETGELLNLSLDPDTGDQRVGGTDRTDIAGGMVVFGSSWMISDPYPGVSYSEVVAFDLATRTRRQITNAIADQYLPTVSEQWIAWADQRNAPSFDWFHPCHGDIYAYDRSTGVEIPLVIEGEALHGPSADAEGPWLVYNDQRWDPEPDCDSDREQDIVALHVPTRTEIRITDWPGMEAGARVYDRRDGTYGVLLIADVPGSGDGRLWDCDLPEPPGP
jgi:hypothetical protein